MLPQVESSVTEVFIEVVKLEDRAALIVGGSGGGGGEGRPRATRSITYRFH